MLWSSSLYNAGQTLDIPIEFTLICEKGEHIGRFDLDNIIHKSCIMNKKTKTVRHLVRICLLYLQKNR